MRTIQNAAIEALSSLGQTSQILLLSAQGFANRSDNGCWPEVESAGRLRFTPTGNSAGAAAADTSICMERCEGYYRLENRRCDRTATRDARASDGQYYQVCELHSRQWTASVAHWNGQSDIRSSAPTPLRAHAARQARPLAVG